MDTIRELPFGVAVAVLFAIVLVRANATYWLGRWAIHRGGPNPRLRALVAGRSGVRAKKLAAKFGPFAVTISFLTIGIQTAINFGAGMTQMPLSRYVPAVVAGCMVWALLYASAGVVALELLVRLFRQ